MPQAVASPKLPDQVFVHIPSESPAHSICLVRLGESGYQEARVQRPPATHTDAERLVHALNAACGVTPLQAECMLVGSMFGWSVPGADPTTYTSDRVETINRAAGLD